MTDAQLIKDMQSELRDIRKLLYGDPSTGKGGMAHSHLRMGEDLYGTDHSDGVMKEVAGFKRIVWIGIGVLGTAQIGLQIVFHFWK